MSKEYISMPLPIDNVFGESDFRGKDFVILFVVLGGLWASWIFILFPLGISWKVMLVLSIIFFLYWLSEIYGKGKQKRAMFRRQLSGQLSEEHEIIGITMIDGADVFYSETVVNYLVGELKFYTDGNQLTLDFERFLDGLSPMLFNTYFVNLPIEEDFSSDASNVVIYNDKQVAQERYDYYLYQQKIIDAIKGYTVIIGLKAPLDRIDFLHDKISSVLKMDAKKCFTKLSLAEGDMLNLILGSDLGYEVDINMLLDNKYYDSATMSSLKVIERGNSNEK